MTATKGMRERHVWIVVTTVLGMSLVWIATLSVVLLWNVYGGRFPEALVLTRAIARAALAVAGLVWPAALGALVAAGLLFGLAHRAGARAQRRVSHA